MLQLLRKGGGAFIKKVMITVLVVLVCFAAFYFIKQKEEPKIQSEEKTVTSSAKEDKQSTAQLPSLAELEKKYGDQLIEKGEYTIVTAFYKENPHVQLSNKEQEELELTISNIKEEEIVTFSIDNLETIYTNKQIGEQLKLIQLKTNQKYIEYK